MAKHLGWILVLLSACPHLAWAGWGEPVRLAYPVNLEGWESLDPFITRDGHQLYFVTSRPEHPGEDIWVVRWNGVGWDSLTWLGPNVNTSGWRQIDPSVSADGKKLYFATGGGYGGFDLWVSTWQDRAWGVAGNLGPNINTGFTERSVCISADGSTLYIGANRYEPPFLSLWTSHWDGTAWTPLELMGDSLNDPHYDSYEPFISANESVLYYIRWTGWNGMDILSSQWEEGGWSDPETLSYPINTPYHDFGPCLSPEGRRLYFSSTREETLTNYPSYIYVSEWDTTGIEQEARQGAEVLPRTGLDSVFPNPARREVRVVYTVEKASIVQLSVYDLLGRKVATLVRKEEDAGKKEVIWRNKDGKAGVYFVRLDTGGQTFAERVVMLD